MRWIANGDTKRAVDFIERHYRVQRALIIAGSVALPTAFRGNFIEWQR